MSLNSASISSGPAWVSKMPFEPAARISELKDSFFELINLSEIEPGLRGYNREFAEPSQRRAKRRFEFQPACPTDPAAHRAAKIKEKCEGSER